MNGLSVFEDPHMINVPVTVSGGMGTYIIYIHIHTHIHLT